MNEQAMEDPERVVLVEAGADEIRSLLQEELTEEEYNACSISWIERSAETRRGPFAEIGFSAIQFFFAASAGGLTWDLTKKVGEILRKKYDDSRVTTTTKKSFSAALPPESDEPGQTH